MTDEVRCRNCKFFETFEYEGMSYGRCCRFPPFTVATMKYSCELLWSQPLTNPQGWCGEFQLKEQEVDEDGES